MTAPTYAWVIKDADGELIIDHTYPRRLAVPITQEMMQLGYRCVKVQITEAQE